MAYGQWDDEILPQMPMQPQQQQQQQQPQQAGLLDRLMTGFQNFTSDPDRMARMAMATNTMRLTPDAGLHAALADRLKDSRALNLVSKQANQTAEFFRKQGRDDLANAVESNPMLAKDLLIAYQKEKLQGGTETFRTRQQTAAELGYKPGSPEYKAIMSGQNIIAGGQLTTDQATQAGQLRDDLRTELGTFADSRDAFQTIQTFEQNQGPVSDYALAVAFAKVLDPGSVAREGEVAAIANNGSLAASLKANLVSALQGTGRLPPAVRNEIVKLSYELYNKKAERASRTISRYQETANLYGLPLRSYYAGDENIGPVEYSKPQQNITYTPLQDGWYRGSDNVLYYKSSNGNYYTEEQLRAMQEEQAR